jgi:diguanylate cyclase (GGDEF)-like protein
MLGKPLSDFLMSQAAEHYINAFRNCLIGGSITGLETTFLSRNGDEIDLAMNMVPVYDSEDIVGTQGSAFDVTEQKHADEMLQYISAKDELTGLYNLHTFISMTEQQIKSALREKKDMLIIYAGVDGMEAINEIQGRDSGDSVLGDVADILRKTFREADILARSGGDEFVISTLVSSKDHDTLIIDRLHASINEYNAGKGDDILLSVSFGAAFYDPENPGSINEVLSQADEKMHDVKESKRD